MRSPATPFPSSGSKPSPGLGNGSSTRPGGSAVADTRKAGPAEVDADGPSSVASSRPVGGRSGRIVEHLAGRRYRIVAATAAVLVVADQLTKWWAVNRLSGGRDIDLIGSLRLRLAFNSGAAFSLGSDSELGPLIAVLALAVVAVLLFSGSVARTRTGALAVGLIAGGAIGNLADRTFRQGGSSFLGGYVVDFVDLQWWPAFNVADAAICVGALGVALLGLRAPVPVAADR